LEFISDTHVHIYPVHNHAKIVAGAASRLMRYATTYHPVIALFLAEARGFNSFAALRKNANTVSGREREALLVPHETQAVWIFAGRQIVTSERLEILALTYAENMPDGLPATEVVRRVRETGGVPVLAWAPGKWLFKRAAEVQRLLDEFGPEDLLLGDSSLRPVGWPEPRAMKMRKTLAGSDPLPFAGEEEQAGCYGMRLEINFDDNRPASSMRAALMNPKIPVERIGSRNTPWSMVHRILKHRQQKRVAR
jgi:hypothetical protein